MKIAISGFGRIGKTFLRTVLQDPHARENLHVVAINVGPARVDTVAHLFKYDTVMGTFPGSVVLHDNQLIINDQKIALLAEKEPANIPWKEYGVDWVVECSGKFTDGQLARKHISAGAGAVLISAPAKNEVVSIIPGVNDAAFDAARHKIVSLGSCTTNAFIPLLHTLHTNFGVVQGFMNTTHAYANTQALLDVDVGDLRRSRAAALNIIPTSTGAMDMLGKIIPELADVIVGQSLRVPVPVVSLIDFTFLAQKQISAERMHAAFAAAAQNNLRGKLALTHEQLVSSDFCGDAHSVTVDGALTAAVGQMGRVVGWYDNEWGYSSRLKDFLVSCCG